MSTPDNHDSQSHVTPGADLWSKASAASAEAPAAAAKASGNGGWERDVLEKLVFASIKEQRAA